MTNKELDIAGCRTFVCPNMDLLNQWARRLKLSDTVLEKAKAITNEYVKRTYHRPKYTSIKPVLAACLYIAAIICGERRTQEEIHKISRVSHRSICKWYMAVYDELCKKRENLHGNVIDFWKETGAIGAMKDQPIQFDFDMP